MTTNTEPQIKMCACTSSMLSHHGYDPASKIMAITFKGGITYHYHDVPPEAYDALVKAKSLGGHFGKHIRGTFRFTPQPI